MKEELHILFKNEHGRYSAHALEYDILGVGEDKAAALSNLKLELGANLSFCKHQNVEFKYHLAPINFWSEWASPSEGVEAEAIFIEIEELDVEWERV